jgi:hypothetical protein
MPTSEQLGYGCLMYALGFFLLAGLAWGMLAGFVYGIWWLCTHLQWI